LPQEKAEERVDANNDELAELVLGKLPVFDPVAMENINTEMTTKVTEDQV
jgi:hypothetical protein